jgi:heat shock protein HtpX
MRHPQLKLRMAVVGAILFAFYAALVAFFQSFLSLPVVLAGTLVFAVAQYKLGKYLALRSVGAQELPEDEFQQLQSDVEALCEEMDVPKPELRVARMGVPNAFAVGRKGSGVVVVSAMLLDVLEPDEVRAVLAHELAHIRNRDVLMMVIGQSIAAMLGITVFWLFALSDGIITTIIGWVLSTLVQLLVTVFVMAISRYREYVADSDAAQYTGNPTALARALTKIDAVGSHEEAPELPDNVGALCIFGGKRGLLDILFASHPTMEKRIEKLDPSVLDRREQVLADLTR